MERLLEILDSFRREGHYCNDDDGFYSCPMAENYIGEGTKCNCYLEENNAKVEEAIAIVKRLDHVIYGGA